MTLPRNEVCFSGADGCPPQPQLLRMLTELRSTLEAKAITAALVTDPLELRLSAPSPMRLIAIDAGTHCALQLWDEPIDDERFHDSPSARAVLQALHDLVSRQGFDQEWIGLDDDIDEKPFD